MNLGNVFWDWGSMQTAGVFPSILAIGDSWFWYPMPGGSLLNKIGPMVAPKNHNILAIGNNGAEVYDYVTGKYKTLVRKHLWLQGNSLSAVFISGGGNDFAGFNDLRPLLFENCSKAKSPSECFKENDGDFSLDRLLTKTAENYQLLIGQIMAATNQTNAKIFVHNYAYPIPTGKGFFKNNSSWLKSALDDAKVPEKLQAPCMAYVIDQFSSMLSSLLAIDNERIILIDSKSGLTESDWANELHPTGAGFKKLAQNYWLPQLKLYGMA